jgi:Leucine rich repeat
MKLWALVLLLLAPVDGLEFHCQFRYMTWGTLLPNGSEYGCLNPRITQSGDRFALTNVIGDHLPGKTMADVKILYVNGSSANVDPDLSTAQLPREIGRFFPNLIGFAWANMDLAKISQSDLKVFPDLIIADLQINKIVAIDGNLFQSTRKLMRINLTSNLIQHVGSNLLSNLNDLEAIDIADNPCISFHARNQEQFDDLMMLFDKRCSPSSETTTVASTTADDCRPRCSINDEVDELRKENQMIVEEIKELRRLIREIEANPCIRSSLH